MSLPSQRQLLTSLISSLSNPTAGPPLPDTPPSLEQRHLLFTLHVLFPTLLLPALDLLDRNLVTRVTLDDSSAEAGPGDGSKQLAEQAGNGRRPVRLYLVKSLASTVPARERQKRRHQDVLGTGVGTAGGSSNSAAAAAAGTLRKYMVKLDAWHCTCPGFTLDAFSHVPQHQQQNRIAPGSNATAEQAPEMQPHDLQNGFGGSSLDGLVHAGGRGEEVPCCKHILACLLAQVWEGHRGVNMDDRRVSVDEMAGIVANM